MEKKEEEANLPPSYMNLGFDSDVTAGPSAPMINDGASGSGIAYPPGPSAPPPAVCPPGPSVPPPKYEEAGHSTASTILKIPTAPPTETDHNMLKCTLPSLLFEDIYEACIKHVKSNCCYSSRFVKQMKLTSIENKSAFHYALESFGEKRESASRQIPYRGGSIDGPNNGPAPRPWDMLVSPSELFKKGKKEVAIPHTDEVRTCSKCSGRGQVTCWNCSGSGWNSCSSCSGSGRDSDDGRCWRCSGSGRDTCSSCSGSGETTCSTCDGYGKVKNYRVLIVTWENHLTEFTSNIHKLPVKKIKKVTGERLVYEAYKKLNPIMNAPDPSVNAASRRLLEAHDNSFPNELIIRQRHRLYAIPFTVAKYKWKEEEGEFYIYGKERDIFFEYYPTNCCCICC